MGFPSPCNVLLTDKLSSYIKGTSIDPRAVHSLSLKLGCLFSIFLSNNLLHSYVSRSNLPDACKLFEEISHPNVVTWSHIISCYAQLGNLKDALLLFRKMQQRDGLLPSTFTFGSIVTGCTRVKDSRAGRQLHCCLVKFGFESDTFIADALIDMYAKCGMIGDSCRLFDQTLDKDVVSWTTMITNLANSGQCEYRNATFGLFKDMVARGIWPVNMTFASLVKVFGKPTKLNQAKQAHGYMLKFGIKVDDHLESALLAMYGRCAGIDEIVRLSSRMSHCGVVSRTSLLVAYVQNGYGLEVIEVFRRMVEENVTIDHFVIGSVIGACSAARELRKGKEIHGYTFRRSFTWDVSVGNSLITFYGKCGEILKSEKMFKLMGDRDIITWTAMLTCYSQNDCGVEALSFFRQMLRAGICPAIYTVTGAICACSQGANLAIGRQIHSKSVKMGIDANLSVGNSLITMYANCRQIEDASRVFNYMTERDVVSWNALITGFSNHGLDKEALELFQLMEKDGIRPDNYTFIGILTSCGRGGLIAEGWEYFRLMKVTYGVEPEMEHYACMVDLLGRAGKLHEAVDFINSMPFDPDVLIWEALLASCKLYGDDKLGKFTAKEILEMKTEGASPCITLSSIHASMGMWRKKASFLGMMKERGVQKKRGKRWIEDHQWLEDSEDALQAEGTFR